MRDKILITISEPDNHGWRSVLINNQTIANLRDHSDRLKLVDVLEERGDLTREFLAAKEALDKIPFSERQSRLQETMKCSDRLERSRKIILKFAGIIDS